MAACLVYNPSLQVVLIQEAWFGLAWLGRFVCLARRLDWLAWLASWLTGCLNCLDWLSQLGRFSNGWLTHVAGSASLVGGFNWLADWMEWLACLAG